MSAKNKWLIKSDSKILGPYSYEQVEDLILKKQISLIDEIRDMQTRWLYVREVPEFKNFVESVRQSGDQKSDMTQTIQTALQKTNTKSEVIMTDAGMNFSEVEIVQTPSSEDITSEPKSPSQVSPNKQNRISYVSPKESETVNRRSLTLKVSLICVVVLGLVGTLWYYFNNSDQSRNERALFQQIRKYNLYGLDDRSISAFKKLSPSSHEKILVDIVPLWPQLESAGVIHPEQILDIVTTGKLEGNERNSQYQLFKFVNSYKLGDTQNAQDALIKAIDLDPSSLDVKENNAIFSYTQKKYSEAAKIFKNLYDQSGWGRYLYGEILSQISANALDAAAAIKSIEKHLEVRVDFAKELMLLQLYIIKKNQTAELSVFDQYFKRFVDFPQGLSGYFRINNLIASDLYRWEYLKPLISQLSQGLNDKQKFMLNFNYLLEKGDYLLARETYQKYLLLLDDHEKNNLEISLDYLSKNYKKATQLQVDDVHLNLSSRLYLLIMHSESQSSAQLEEKARYTHALQQEKPLFANWAQLMLLSLPKDKEQIRSLINKDTMYNHDFKPYLNLKAALSE